MKHPDAGGHRGAEGFTNTAGDNCQLSEPPPSLQAPNGSALPSPLTLPDCDLRGLPWLQLDVAELRDGPVAEMTDPEARWAAVLALAVAWHQVPAASLPNSDASLCRLLGYGRDIATWQRVREAGALDGWLLCADGRLYLPSLAAKARDAWQSRQKRQAAGAKGNARRWGEEGRSHRDAVAEESQCDRNAIGERSPGDRRREVEVERNEKKEEERKQDSAPLRVANDAPAPSVHAVRELVGVPETTLNPRRSRIKADWQPNQRDRDFAAERGIDADAEIQGFRDNHTAKGSLMVDWSAAWRTWIGNAVKFRVRSGGGARPGKTDWLHQRAGRPGRVGWLVDEMEARNAQDGGPIIDGRAEPWAGAETTKAIHPHRTSPPEAWGAFADSWGTDAKGRRHPVCGGWHIDTAADLVCEAAGIQRGDWRGDWNTLAAWLRDDIDLHETILPTIRERAKCRGYRPPATLKFFDAQVRNANPPKRLHQTMPRAA